jgi:hypothetical protein
MLLGALVGCEERSTVEDTPAAVETIEAGAAPEAGWALAETPTFSITRSSLDPERFFDGPLGGAFLANGSIVIRDGGTSTLTFLDALGRPIRSAGREGDGPGEFRRLSAIFPVPDGSGVWTWDSRSSRMSHFDENGDYLTSLTPRIGSASAPEAILPGPTFVTLAEAGGAANGVGRREYVLRDTLWNEVARVSGPPELAPPVLHVEVPGGTYVHNLPEGCVPVLDEVAIDGRIFTADASAGTIESFAEDGAAREVYRMPRRRPFTTESRNTLVAQIERRLSIPGREPPAGVRRAALDDLRSRLGAYLPAWQRVIGDATGRIWLEYPECPRGDDSGSRYEVVDVTTGDAAFITVPEALTILAVHGDQVLARRTGEFGVQHVELYQVVR